MMVFRRSVFLIIFCTSTLLLSCKSTELSWQILKAQIDGKEQILNPTYEYLLTHYEGRKVHLALGYREFVNDHIVEYWYSGAGEMLEISDGRVKKALGMIVEIRGNQGDPPLWASFSELHQSQTWRRKIDLMPGYRFGVEETITTRLLKKNETPLFEKKRTFPRNTNWFLEVVTSQNIQGQQEQYQQIFAVNKNQVIYSEQCLHKSMCMSFQPVTQLADEISSK